MCRRLKRNEEGFTFADALLQLLMLSVLLPLIVVSFRYFALFFDETEPKELEWELFKLDFVSYAEKADSVSVIRNGKGVRFLEGTESVTIELYDAVLRKQRSGQGHEIMLTDLRDANFLIKEGEVRLAAEFRDGLRKETVHALPVP